MKKRKNENEIVVCFKTFDELKNFKKLLKAKGINVANLTKANFKNRPNVICIQLVSKHCFPLCATACAAHASSGGKTISIEDSISLIK